MIVLVINCGSSSIKYQVYKMPEKTVLAKGIVERIGLKEPRLTHKFGDQKHEAPVPAGDHNSAMDVILKTLTDAKLGVIKEIKDIRAVGHRVVHGGEAYSGSVIIDDQVIKAIESFCDLAPLHNPPNLTGIRAAQAVLPGVPMVAVFDTAFHQTIPPHAYLYALPYELYEKYRVRKYGFHGTSHAYVARRAAQLLNIPADAANLVTCHLGNGGSITCVRMGKSIDTSMGMTPLPGVIMGTRSGDLDPAILLYLMGKDEYKDPRKLDELLNKKSGLLGISGKTSDMRDLEDALVREGKASRAKLALDMFCYRVQFYIGAYMAQLNSVDAVVFTGGIGENGSLVRQLCCQNLRHLGVALDDRLNRLTMRGKEGEISTSESKVKVLVIPTDEEGYIANETHQLCERRGK